MEFIVVYITAKDMEEAKKIKEFNVEEKLAACVNIFPEIKSCYWWKGEKEKADEVALIAKTKKDLVDKLTKRVKEIHSYDVPCVIALPIVGGNEDFLKWIGESVE